MLEHWKVTVGLLVIAIITLVVIYISISSVRDWYCNINIPAWGYNTVVIFIVLIVSLLLLVWACSYHYITIFLFVVVCILLLVWSGFLARSKCAEGNIRTAFYILLVLFIVSVLLSTTVYIVARCHAIGTLPFLLWVVAILGVNYRTAELNCV